MDTQEASLTSAFQLLLSTGKIDLSSSNLSDFETIILSQCLFQSPLQVKFLHLGSNSISDEGIAVLAQGIEGHGEIEELYLGGNLFGSEGFQRLCPVLPGKLRVLSLASAMLQDSDLISLCNHLLSHSSSLTHLYLNSNSISDEGLQTLSITLTSNRIQLTTLHLGDNEFTAQGLISLCEYLPDDHSLKSLFLCDNLLEMEGADVLGQALTANTSLELLSLAHCGLTDESIRPILAGLVGNEQLCSLHLWGNLLSDESCELLAQILARHNHVLTDILLFDNQITNYMENLDV